MESISRISSLLETARDLTLEAASSASASTHQSRRTATTAKPLPPAQIKRLLDSRHEREVLDGLRRVIAMQHAVAPPQPTLPFFPAVLKTLSNPYPSTRPLVYNYLVHHSEKDPDTALLSINTIQKSLSDSNPRVRAMALKTMAGIKVSVISQIVSLAIKKGTTDLSPLVRKAAALACVKCVRLDESTRPQVEEYLATLLGDKQYYVAGAAVQAFMEICPERLDLVHGSYRRLCRMVVDMDEWGQLAVIGLMTGYARRCFPRRTKRVKRAAQTREEKVQDFYEDLEPAEQQQQDNEADYDELELLDPDLNLFLKSIEPLLQSRNSAVVVAVTKAYLYLSPTTHLPLAIGPLIALLRSPQDIQQVALHNLVQVCLTSPKHFVPYLRHFLIRSTEPPTTRTLKLEVLTLIFPYCGKDVQDLVLAELEHFSRSHDAELVRESVRAIGRCAQASSGRTGRRCLSLLLKQIHSPDQNLVGEAIEVVRHLIQRSPQEHSKTVVRLAKNLDTLKSAAARASIVWLVGEYAAGGSGEEAEQGIAADVLRILVKGYADESDEVRAQIVLLAAKVYLHFLNGRNAKRKAVDALSGSSGEDKDMKQRTSGEVRSPTEEDDREGFREDAFASQESRPEQLGEEEKSHPIELLYQHTMLLARYTPSYDLRDRARLYRALLSVPSSTELASLLLLAPKPVPQAPSPSETRRNYSLGSASLVVGEEAGINGLRGYDPIPEWVAEGQEPDAKLRDETGEAGRVEYGAPRPALSAGQRLDEVLGGGDVGYKSSASPRKEKTLDDWLDEEGTDEEEGSSEGSGDGEGSEESGTDEESDDDEEVESSEESEEDEKAGLVR